MSLIHQHKVVFESAPFRVFYEHRDKPLAVFVFRVDAFRYAKVETVSNPGTGETGFPWLVVESHNASETHWFRNGERMSDPRKGIQ